MKYRPAGKTNTLTRDILLLVCVVQLLSSWTVVCCSVDEKQHVVCCCYLDLHKRVLPSKEYLLKKGGCSVIERKSDELCRLNLYCTTQWYIPHLSWAVGKSCPFSRETRGTVEGRAGSFANNHHGGWVNVAVPVTLSSYCILCDIRDIV
jgi:hypothetical protein